MFARRGRPGLINLDLALLHAPLIADGWNSFLTTVRTCNSLPVEIREIAFCRVAALTQAWYEWNIHVPIARQVCISDVALQGLQSVSHADWGRVGHRSRLASEQAAVVEVYGCDDEEG